MMTVTMKMMRLTAMMMIDESKNSVNLIDMHVSPSVPYTSRVSRLNKRLAAGCVTAAQEVSFVSSWSQIAAANSRLLEGS